MNIAQQDILGYFAFKPLLFLFILRTLLSLLSHEQVLSVLSGSEQRGPLYGGIFPAVHMLAWIK